MSESSTAEIIPFPSRPTTAAPATPALAEPTAGELRLSRALANLNDAVAEQRAAIAAWRASLSELGTATSRLGASLRGYNGTLGQLDARVATLRSESVKLEAWADVSAKDG